MINWINKTKLNSENIITGEKFEKLHDESTIIYSQIKSNPFYKTNKTKSLEEFLEKYKNKKVILITHNGDEGITENEVKKVSPVIEKWYGQNVECLNPLVIPLPIGIENSYWPVSNIKINYILNQKENFPNNHTYVNFNILTFPEERKNVLNFFKDKSFCTVTKYAQDYKNIKGVTQYFDEIKNHKFVISPRGNGLDCHRTWETLYLNRIPIIKNNYKMKNLFEDLPVIFVDNFEKITKEFLDREYEKICSKTYNFEKLTIEYWNKIILEK